MRCSCCNKTLNDFEATMKHAITGEYLDTCRKCLSGLGIPIIEREDLNEYEDPEIYDDISDEFLDTGEDE